MKYDKKTLKEVLDLNKTAKLVLPNFQRGFVWKAESQQRTLLSSFILELPIGSILTFEGSRDDFAARDLCTPSEVDPNQDCLYLLDGQQRVSTLKSMFCNLFSSNNWRVDWDNIFRDLRNRWFISVENKTSDFFGINTLNFNGLAFKAIEPEQFLENLNHKKIQIGNSSSWFHPGYSPSEAGVLLDDLSKRRKIATAAADDLLVPMYEMYGHEGGTPLHKLVLARIADKKAQDLKTIYENDEEGAIALLYNAEQDIREFYASGDTNRISLAWSKLAISWATNVSKFLEGIINYELSQINLPSDEIARAFAIFEVINQPGTPLDIYDLIAAKAARNRDLPALTNRINAIIDEEIPSINAATSRVIGPKPSSMSFGNFGLVSDATPAKITRNQYLNLLSLFTHVDYGSVGEINKVEYIKRARILSVGSDRINEITPLVINAIKRAAVFLHFRCGIEKINLLNYELMLLPIAYAVANDDFWSSSENLDKIEYWYWSSLFSGSYRENQNGRCVEDIKLLFEWLSGGTNPFLSRVDNIFKAVGYSDLKVLVLEDEDNSVPNAIHHGILQYVLSKQPHDFIKANPEIRLNTWDILNQKPIVINGKAFTLSVQDHHIYPLSASTSLYESTQKYRADKKFPLNSPLNRTYISSAANGIIRDAVPSEYFLEVSQYAQDEHSLPLDLALVYVKLPNEEDAVYYKRLLKSRYDILTHDVRVELSALAGS